MAAFNVAPYVEQAVQSVLQQDFRDFELIIVDDASTDGTRDILQNLAGLDSRIRLFLKEQNEGLAVARNLGIAQAQGEWVTFLDADDLYDTSMIRKAYDLAHRTQAHMVLWDYVVFKNEKDIGPLKQRRSELETIDPSNRHSLLKRPAFAWTRLVKRSCLETLNIQFPHGLTYQDVPVHWKLVTQLDKIALLPERLACYRQQPNATTAGQGMKRADYFTVLDQVDAYLTKAQMMDVYGDLFTAQQLNAWQGVYDVVAKAHKPTVYAMIDAAFTDRHQAYLTAQKPLRWQTRQFFKARGGHIGARMILHTRRILRHIYRWLRRVMQRG